METTKQQQDIERRFSLMKIAQQVGHVLSGPHQLASHGEHFVEDLPEVTAQV